MSWRVIGASFGLALAFPAHAVVLVTFEDAGVQNTTAGFDRIGVERFETRALGGNRTFSSNFGGNGIISGTYTGVDINSANVYGGAGGAGRFAATFSTTGYDLALTSSDPGGVNYFGYWLSALDRNNRVEFFRDGESIFTFAPNAVLNVIGDRPAYYANPNPAFAGGNNGETYAFVNVYFTAGDTFDRVRFYQAARGGGYESDNHTVGFYNRISGNTVPEPATWAMMIVGFGLVGYMMRRRRAISVVHQ